MTPDEFLRAAGATVGGGFVLVSMAYTALKVLRSDRSLSTMVTTLTTDRDEWRKRALETEDRERAAEERMERRIDEVEARANRRIEEAEQRGDRERARLRDEVETLRRKAHEEVLRRQAAEKLKEDEG